MEIPKDQPNQLNIEISEEVSEGVYANLAIITHSHAEFVVDFVNVMPGTPKSKVKSRIILTPTHAKRFMKAMIDNVKKFESVNGTIQDIECLLYTSDAADDLTRVDLGGRRIIKKK